MVGIDIGSKSIKIIESVKSSDGWTLKASGVVGYSGNPPDTIISEEEFVKIGELLKMTLKQIKVSSKEVNLGLPERLVFTRVIKFPMLTDEELSSAIKWEAEQYVPIPLNEAVVQHTLLEKKEESSEILVLLVAAPRVVIEKYIKIVRLAGLDPLSAETELMAMVRCMSPVKGVSMILDIGANSTNMAIVEDSKIFFTRSVPIAGEAFTRAVAQGMNIQGQQAEEYKRTYGLSSQLEGKVKNTLEPIMHMIVDEIKKAIHFYQSDRNGGQAPSSIVITGGSSFLPEIQSYLTSSLGIETGIGDPFAKFKLEPEIRKNLDSYAPYYNVAAGLSMRED